MRRLIVLEFISLDGVIQSPGGANEDASEGFSYGGWVSHYFDSVSTELMQKQMESPFDLLLGRKTFEIWAPYWPKHDDVWPAVNKATKYVASHTMKSHSWQPTVFLNGDVAKEVAEIKRSQGPDLHVYGSADLLQTLLAHDLVDELWLKVHPITFGGGKRLFAKGTIPAAFRLTESTVTSKGIIFANYERAGAIVTQDVEVG